MTHRPVSSRSLSWAASLAFALAASGCHWKSATERAAEPIVARNAEARGGLDAWRKVKTLSLSGKLDAGTPRDPVKLARAFQRSNTQVKADLRRALAQGAGGGDASPVRLPFAMELKRPRRSRVEIRFQGQTAVQVYDGTAGWKLRPFLGRREVEPFTAEELRVAAQQADLDGPLVDHEAKGSRVALLGTEPVDGRDTYKLEVTSGKGEVRHVWVDAKTSLDVMVDGTRRMDGKPRLVRTRLRDYRAVDGVLIPFELETSVEGVRGSERIVVERAMVNAPVDDRRFAKPD
jgi:hypothetical protein